MYLVTSKSPMGHIRRAIAASLDVACDLARRLREQNPRGLVVIEHPNGTTVVGGDDEAELPFEATQSMQLW